MNQTKSSKEKTTVSIGKAMRPLWGAGIPATMALSALIAIGFAIALDGCSSSSKSNKANLLRLQTRRLVKGSEKKIRMRLLIVQARKSKQMGS